MTRLEALKELTAAVEAGNADADIWRDIWRWEKVWDMDTAIRAKAAYNGSLDAAKALHDAVLKGWVYFLFGADYETCIGGEVHPPRAIVSKGRAAVNLVTHSGENNIPACAWLLAILRALIAQEESKQGD